MVHIYLIHKWYREDGTEGYLRWENSLAKSNKSSFINYIDFLNWYRRVNFPVQYNIATCFPYLGWRLYQSMVRNTELVLLYVLGMMMMAYQILHQFWTFLYWGKERYILLWRDSKQLCFQAISTHMKYEDQLMKTSLCCSQRTCMYICRCTQLRHLYVKIVHCMWHRDTFLQNQCEYYSSLKIQLYIWCTAYNDQW